MRRKFYAVFAMLILLTLTLAACGGGSSDSGDKGESSSSGGDKPKFLSLLTGGTSGTYYPLGGEIAKIFTDETGIQTDVQSSNASADNIMALSDNQAELAFVQTDVMAAAVEGVQAFEEHGAVDNVLALGSLYPETIQIVTLADSGIESVEDLKGKKVSVGAPGSGTYVNAEQILEVHGMTMDDIQAQNLDFGESAGGLKDGNIDAAFITAGAPTGAVEEISATNDINIIPIEQEKVDALIEKYPYYAADTIPAGTYSGIEADVNTVAVMAMIAVSKDLSDDVVYDLTKGLYENVDKITHGKAEFISLESALDGIDTSLLHPGAEKYYSEKDLLSE